MNASREGSRGAVGSAQPGRPARAQGGLSLIELVVVTVLIGIVAASSVEPLRQVFRGRQQLADSLHTLGELRHASERIARELQQVAWQPGAGLRVEPIAASLASSSGLCFTRIGSSPEAAAVTVVILVQNARVVLDYQACAATPAHVLLESSSALRFDYFTLNPADGSKTALSTTASDFRSRLRYVDITVSREVAGGTLSHTTGVLLRNGVWGDGAGGT
jgi:prepilin-type N-terminal cleavage/methylation domain-containing protein